MGSREGRSPTPGESRGELASTLLGGVRGVGGVSGGGVEGATSSGEVSWPNMEKLNNTVQ